MRISPSVGEDVGVRRRKIARGFLVENHTFKIPYMTLFVVIGFFFFKKKKRILAAFNTLF